MYRQAFVVLCTISLVVGCTSTPTVSQPTANQLWHDKRFDYKASDVLETKEMLFALDPELNATLVSKRQQIVNADRRLEYLASLLFNGDHVRINYAAGHSTGAAETWQTGQGDCLSLTLLTHSASTALGITATMQEVRVPVAVDRRGGIDYVNGHVNLYVNNNSELLISGRIFPVGGVFIDFAPQIGSRRHGKRLTDDQIVARYYNNRATEYLAVKDDKKAYAYFKAAILSDPTFASAYGNLAQLYTRHALSASAESLLRHAMSLNSESDVPLRKLHALMIAQNREEEAAKLALQLREHENEDPYYWVSVGLDHLKNQHYRKAVDALERAENLTSGFEEVHRYLAVAYWRNGQQKQANKELSVLATMLIDDPAVAKLSAKLGRSPGEASVQ